MTLFNFEPEKGSQGKKFRMRIFLFLGAVGALAAVGTSLANQMTLNSNGTMEFGQGFMSTTTCDPNGIKVTPINSFYNKENSGVFTFNAIQLEHISSACAGMDILIQVYNKDGVPQEITRDGVRAYTVARVYFHALSDSVLVSSNEDGEVNTVSASGYWADQFTLVGEAPIVVGTLSNLFQNDAEVEPESGLPATGYFSLDNEENSVQVTFDPSGDLAAGFTDTRNVYHITVESRNH